MFIPVKNFEDLGQNNFDHPRKVATTKMLSSELLAGYQYQEFICQFNYSSENLKYKITIFEALVLEHPKMMFLSSCDILKTVIDTSIRLTKNCYFPQPFRTIYIDDTARINGFGNIRKLFYFVCVTIFQMTFCRQIDVGVLKVRFLQIKTLGWEPPVYRHSRKCFRDKTLKICRHYVNGLSKIC